MVENDEEESLLEEFENDQIEVEKALEEFLRNQSQRIGKLNSSSKKVSPTYEGRLLLDASIESFYALSCVSATREYLVFFDTAVETNMLECPVVGELVSDWAISTEGNIRRLGTISVGLSGAIAFWDEEGHDHLIATAATTFCEIIAAFTEYRSSVCKIEYDEYDSGFVCEDDEKLELDLSRTFWMTVARTDPHVLSSGSKFWSRLVNDAILWRD